MSSLFNFTCIIFDIAIFIHLSHLRHIIQYICVTVFERIFWNNSAAVTVTLKGGGGLKNRS